VVRTRKRIDTGHCTTSPDAPAPGQEALRLDGYQEAGLDDVRAVRRLYAHLTGQQKLRLWLSFPQGEREETQQRVRQLVAERLQGILEWRDREERRTGIYLADELLKAAALPEAERDARIAQLEQIRLDRVRRQPALLVPRERYHTPGCTYPDPKGSCHGCESIAAFTKRAKREAKLLGLKPATIILREHVEWAVKFQRGKSYTAIAKSAGVHPRNVRRKVGDVLKIVGIEPRRGRPGRPQILTS
jgi:hypothetical protein